MGPTSSLRCNLSGLLVLWELRLRCFSALLRHVVQLAWPSPFSLGGVCGQALRTLTWFRSCCPCCWSSLLPVFILYFVSVDGVEVFVVDGCSCCPALLRLAAGLTLSALVGLSVWSRPACFQPFFLLVEFALLGSFVVVLLYQVVFEGMVATCASWFVCCVGSCMVTLALRAGVRVAGPSNVKKQQGLCCSSLFLPVVSSLSGQCLCRSSDLARLRAERLCWSGSTGPSCSIAFWWCASAPTSSVPVGKHGCNVTALSTLGSDTSAGFTAAAVMVLLRGLCRWPGECGHVLGLHAVAATLCAALPFRMFWDFALQLRRCTLPASCSVF